MAVRRGPVATTVTHSIAVPFRGKSIRERQKAALARQQEKLKGKTNADDKAKTG